MFPHFLVTIADLTHPLSNNRSSVRIIGCYVMTSFSGVTCVLFCFVFVFMLSLKPRPFVQSIVLRCAGAPVAIRVSFSFLEMSLLLNIFCTSSTFSLYGEYVVRSFLPNGVFYLVTTGWIFYISLLCENSINQISISYDPPTVQIHTTSYWFQVVRF